MIACKLAITNFYVFDELAKPPPKYHGNSQPLQSISSLDAVALLPRLFDELNVVENYEEVDLIDKIEVSHPRKERGLVDRDLQAVALLVFAERGSRTFPRMAETTRCAPRPSTSWRHR